MKPYHYIECGLDNIYLINGFVVNQDQEYGETVSIPNLEFLHNAITQEIISSPKKLTNKEIRFLRKELNVSQLRLARILGVNAQTVARWEKGEIVIPGPADRCIKSYCYEFINENSRFIELWNELSELDTELENTIWNFEIQENKWKASTEAA